MNNRTSRFVSIGSLILVVVGILLGILERTNLIQLGNGVVYAELFARTWIVVLIILAAPLVASFLLVSLLTLMKTKKTGKLALRGLGIHVGLLILAAIVSVGLSSILLQAAREEMQLFVPTVTNANYLTWLTESLGLTQAKVARLIIPIILFTVITAALLYRFPDKTKTFVTDKAAFVSNKLFALLSYLFMALPISAGCLALVITVSNGAMLVEVAGFYVFGVCGVIVFFIGVVYGAVYFFGHTTVKNFARAMLPAQLVAASTCSSLATLPALLLSVKQSGISDEVAGSTVPLFVSFFRINLMVANPFSFFLLSRLYDLPIEGPNLLLFLSLMMLTSFGSPGLPQTGNVYSLPVFLAAGIPLEGVVLLKALDAIPDVFKTVLNVTETGAVTSIMMRWPSYGSQQKTPTESLRQV